MNVQKQLVTPADPFQDGGSASVPGPLTTHKCTLKIVRNAGQDTSDRFFYVGVGLAFLLIVFAGFVRSYYLRPLFGFRSLPTLLHFHGLVMSLWFVLFLTQAGLISAGRIALHRQLGVFGTFLAASVVILGGDVCYRRGPASVHAIP